MSTHTCFFGRVCVALCVVAISANALFSVCGSKCVRLQWCVPLFVTMVTINGLLKDVHPDDEIRLHQWRERAEHRVTVEVGCKGVGPVDLLMECTKVIISHTHTHTHTHNCYRDQLMPKPNLTVPRTSDLRFCLIRTELRFPLGLLVLKR